jgi:hypothetical protein
VICLSRLDMICSSILLVCMIRLIPAIIIMLYYYLFWIKSYGKFLIYSTEVNMERHDGENRTKHMVPTPGREVGRISRLVGPFSFFLSQHMRLDLKSTMMKRV